MTNLWWQNLATHVVFKDARVISIHGDWLLVAAAVDKNASEIRALSLNSFRTAQSRETFVPHKARITLPILLMLKTFGVIEAAVEKFVWSPDGHRVALFATGSVWLLSLPSTFFVKASQYSQHSE